MRILSMTIAFVAGLSIIPAWEVYHGHQRYRATGTYFYE